MTCGQAEMRIAGLVQDSIVDGPGLRFVVFVQGCDKQCAGCHNPDTWDMGGGRGTTVAEVIEEMSRNPLTDGITLTGGEPLLQAGECAEIAAAARARGLNVWLYTGSSFEELYKRASEDSAVACLLDRTDVLVDGPYIDAEKTLQLRWRGSRNQRVLDMQKSLRLGIAVDLEM